AVLILYCWIVIIVGASLWLSIRTQRLSPNWHILLWTIVFLLVYQDIWEHHFVVLLPVFVVMYHLKRSFLVLVIYALVAVWTPYRLIDPNGLAAYDMSMRWLPLQPALVNIAYHASKIVPTLILWGYIGYTMLMEVQKPSV
ncbi:MAG: hypothetical protein ACYC6L_14410, partial [Anaerolineae bacterium]